MLSPQRLPLTTASSKYSKSQAFFPRPNPPQYRNLTPLFPVHPAISQIPSQSIRVTPNILQTAHEPSPFPQKNPIQHLPTMSTTTTSPTRPLASRDVNTSAPSPTKLKADQLPTASTEKEVADDKKKPPKSMEYHRQVLQNRLDEDK